MALREVGPGDDSGRPLEKGPEATHERLLSGVPAPVIKVGVHEGDPLARAGVAVHLARQHDMTVIHQLDDRSGSSTQDVAVVLLDRLDAAAAIRLRKMAANRGQRVVLVVGELDDRQLELVVEAGVHSIVWRHQASETRLVKAIRAAKQDESDIPGDLLRRLMTHLGRRTRSTVVSTFAPGSPTPRELSVLELVAQGLGTKEIADRLSYSERTVKGILHDVMVRLHLRNRAHAVAHVIREGHM